MEKTDNQINTGPNINDDDSMHVTLQYPYNDKYDYETALVRRDMDKDRVEDIRNGNGFIISEPQGIKKDIKTQGGIFSSRYGSNSISDVDSFNGRYRCKCGSLRGSLHHGETCPLCNTKVMFVDDDVTITGWLILKPAYWIIQPNIYRTLEGFIGITRLNRIIEPVVEVDCNGKRIYRTTPVKKDEPFAGIGILEFKERFDEIMDFYLAKYPGKKMFYDDIMANKDIVFTHSIAVYSSLLRPSRLDNGSLRYEACNEQFNMMANLVYRINQDELSIDRKDKEQFRLLYDLQYQLNSVYNELKEILAKKKGDFRSALGGRCSFTERSVIKQDTNLQADQIRLPFHGLCELLQQVIINILVKTYSFSYADAYKKWYKAQILDNDPVVRGIIQGLINDSDGGIKVLINRNPTISYGGILSCKCIGINDDFTMSISLLILKALGADFDGDTLNIWMMYNKEFSDLAEEIISPRQMFISRNDGRCNGDFIHSRDVIINANGMKSLHKYTPEQIEKIRKLQAMK